MKRHALCVLLVAGAVAITTFAAEAGAAHVTGYRALAAAEKDDIRVADLWPCFGCTLGAAPCPGFNQMCRNLIGWVPIGCTGGTLPNECEVCNPPPGKAYDDCTFAGINCWRNNAAPGTPCGTAAGLTCVFKFPVCKCPAVPVVITGNCHLTNCK